VGGSCADDALHRPSRLSLFLVGTKRGDYFGNRASRDQVPTAALQVQTGGIGD
jgi:hypothetical protein